MTVTSAVGVVGAGNMGAGIAQKLAMEGVRVLLVDKSEAAIARGLERIRALVEEAVWRRVLDERRAEAALARIQPAAGPGALAECGLVIEAVYESFDVKQRLFRQLDGACDPATILATNTSSFRVSDLQAGLRHPHRVVGLHFFYHPAKNRLVEVVGGEASDATLVAAAWRMMREIGKTPIRSADTAGFVVNRFFVPWLNEAVRLLEEGHGTEAQIDAVARAALGVGMGPFALMNATGPQIALAAANTLGQAFGPLYEPARLLERTVSRSERWDTATDEGAEPLPDEQRAVIESRLDGAAWLAAGHLVDAGIAAPEDVDVGARVGLRWRRGPFERANHLGLARAHSDVEGVARRFDLPVPRCFADRIVAGAAPFVLPLVRSGREGRIGTITLNRPSRMNALSPGLLADLRAAWEALEADDDVEAIVIEAAGKAFMAGADLDFFADAHERSDVDALVAFASGAAALLDRMDASPKRVVAVVDGPCVGGGGELALCADFVVATDRASIAFPETGLGLYPALGGTQRSVRRVGRPVSRFLIFSGRAVDARAAHQLGLVDVLAGRGRASVLARELALADDPGAHVPARPEAPHAIGERAAAWFSDEAAPGWLDGSRAVAADPAEVRMAEAIGRKSAGALRKAASLIAMAEQGGDVTAGLAAEVAGLRELFSSDDAREGVRALREGRRPDFKVA